MVHLKEVSEAEIKSVKLTSTYSDLIVGPQRDGAFPKTPSGIQVGSLSAAEKKLVLAAIETYVDDIDDADAAVFMKKYTKELDSTHIAFSGTTTMTTRNDYVRIDGPSVWIEYSAQPSRDFPGTTHPHSVWREHTSDYGGN